MEEMTITDAVCAFPLLLKATPRVEGGQRFLYCEPSNEATDLDNERVLREALKDSRDYFLAKGNLDLDHVSVTGRLPANYRSIPGLDQGFILPRMFEIGRPVEVQFDEHRTFVKGLIYAGPKAHAANYFWGTLEEYVPPMPWYPSVGGHIRDAGAILPKGTTVPVRAIKKVYWNNIGFAREPVNPTIPGVSLVPLGTFAKSWIGPGSVLEFDHVLNSAESSEQVLKTLAAGYGTELSDLTDGAALRTESLHGAYRTQGAAVLSRDIRKGAIKKRGPKLVAEDLIHHLTGTGMAREHAEVAVQHFLSELKKGAQR